MNNEERDGAIQRLHERLLKLESYLESKFATADDEPDTGIIPVEEELDVRDEKEER